MARRYTEQQFRMAIEDPQVRTVADLCRALGIVPRGGNYETVRDVARELGMDLDTRLRLKGGRRRRPPLPLPDEATFRGIVERSTHLSDVICGLGWEPSTTNRRRVHRAILQLGVPTEHFTGRAGSSETRRHHRRVPLRSYLRRGTRVQGPVLRARLIEEGLKEHRCEACRRTTWRGRPIPLELDHVDGDRNDNRLENLRLLCPNCHALTPTYRGRNIGRKAGSIETRLQALRTPPTQAGVARQPQLPFS
jgi:5-methylcytosine-specific restriction endonuclease McrA